MYFFTRIQGANKNRRYSRYASRDVGTYGYLIYIYTVQCALRIYITRFSRCEQQPSSYITHIIYYVLQSRGVYLLRGKTNTRLIIAHIYIIYNIKKTTRWRGKTGGPLYHHGGVFIYIYYTAKYITSRGGGKWGKARWAYLQRASTNIYCSSIDYTRPEAPEDAADGFSLKAYIYIYIYTSGSPPKRGRKLSYVIKATPSVIYIYI